jgi:hypothetical protein
MMDTMASASNDDFFTNLLPENRRIIYDFAYYDATFTVVQNPDSAETSSKSCNFPIALTATCRLLQTEVEDYITRFVSAHLHLDSRINDFAQHGIAPERYLPTTGLSVFDQSSEKMESNNILSHLPNLAEVKLEPGAAWKVIDQTGLNIFGDEPNVDRSSFHEMASFHLQLKEG